MKILVVAPNVDMGMTRGDAVHLRNVTRNWARHHTVHVISSTATSDCPDEIDRLANSSSSLRFLPDYVENSLRALSLTINLQMNHEYDLVYERHHLFGSGLIGSLLCNCAKALEVNGSLVKEHEIRDSISPWTARLLRGIERIVMQLSDRIICVSPKLASVLRDRGVPENKLNVVSNGCDTDLFRPVEDAKTQLDWDEETTHVGFVGGLFDWHGVERVVDAFPRVLAERPRTKYVIVGDGPLKEDLKKQANELGIEDAVEFVGRVPHARVPLYMSAFDVGTILKHPDIPGSPLKLYEYLACGTPVVATDDADFDVLERENVGEKAKYHDPDAIARAILKTIDAKTHASQAARSVAVEHSWEKVSNRVLRVATR